MQMIHGWVGALCLDFLDDPSVEDAQVWLRELPGVDMKVSAAVLNFRCYGATATSGRLVRSPD
jgi:hypothetical protein